jgi:DNA-directed RNA polymerase subunit omega
MARITVEDCLNRVNNRFALIHLAAKRVRQLRKGSEPMILSRNKDIVISLREIAAGKIVKAERQEQLQIDEGPPIDSVSGSINEEEELLPSEDAENQEVTPQEG